MSLRRVVAAPFKRTGEDRVTESEFVVCLSLHREWFSPGQAKRVLDRARAETLVADEGDAVRAQFDPATVTIPPDFSPTESLLNAPSPFEDMLERIVSVGHEKQAAVAEINQLQQDLGLSVEAAAAIYAAREDVDLGGTLTRAIETVAARVEGESMSP